MMTFYLIRHGETENNKKNIVMGQSDSSLSEEGISHSHEIGKKLQNIQFNAIYSSDLGRALQTANIIKQYLKPKQIIFHSALREINYGKYNGTPREIMKQTFPAYRKDISFQFPEGESLLMTQKRSCDFILELDKLHEDETILMISHAGTIRGIISYFTKINLQEFNNSKKNIDHNYVGKFIFINPLQTSYQEI